MRTPRTDSNAQPLHFTRYAAYLYGVVTNNPFGAPYDTSITGVERPFLISGPCSAESEQQVLDTARALQHTGIHLFRAGAWKPRTRPNAFEGIGEPALQWLTAARRETGIPVSTEVANTQHVEACLKAGIDVLWIGARTTVSPFAVQEIATALQGTNVPVFVKNPMHADLPLWMGAIERVRKATDAPVWAIHRGFSRYGQQEYRNAPMWEIAIALQMAMPDLNIICDPSHIAGKRELLDRVAQKAMDLGMHGLMMESHCQPEAAMSDSDQQVTPAEFEALIQGLTIRDAHTGPSDPANLEALRLQMDSIDEQVIELLQTRMNLAREIGQYKKNHGMTILQMQRWKEVFKTRGAWAQAAGLGPEFIETYLEQVHKESIRVQNEEMSQKKYGK